VIYQGAQMHKESKGWQIPALVLAMMFLFGTRGNNLIEETNASGAVVARYTQGANIDEPLAMLRSGATSCYHADRLRTIT